MRPLHAWRFIPPLMLLLAAHCSGPTSPDEAPGSDETRRSQTPAATETPDGTLTSDENTLNTVIVDLRADSNRDGVVSLTDTSDDTGETTWTAQRGAIFLANLDVDDPTRCRYSDAASDVQLAQCHDASDDVINGPDDLLDLAELRVKGWPSAPEGAVGTLAISNAAAPFVRFFRRTGSAYSVFRPEVDRFSSAELRAGVELRLEGKDIVRDPAVWDGFVDVQLRVRAPAQGADRAVDSTDKVRLRIAPVMTFHHLLPAQMAYVSKVPASAYGASASTTFVSALRTALQQSGSAPLTPLGTSDIWAQDFFETGFMSLPAQGGAQHAIRVNFRSANVERNDATYPLRFAGRYVFLLRGKDVAAVQQFDSNPVGDTQSLNSFGNTETLPPYSYNGVSYPLGRLLRGSIPSFQPDRSFSKMLEAQRIQPPVYVDTSWLLVGHVDETLSFVRANTPRGWVALVNDPRLAIQMLMDLQNRGLGQLKMFQGKLGTDWTTDTYVPAERTVSQVLNDTEVMSESIRSAAEVDAQLAILVRETGLTEAEIIRVPVLHEPAYGLALAYQPGMVNGFYPRADTFLAPRPWGPRVDGKDVFEDALERALAPHGVNVRWLDDWDLYHRQMGEVHCGTNAARSIPTFKWWESGR